MTKTYKPLSSHRGVPIKQLFEMLRTTSRTQWEARAKLADALEAKDAEIDPPLPAVWQLKLMQDGGIAILAGDSTTLDPGQIFIKTRNLFPGVRPMGFTVPVMQAAPAPADDAAGKKPESAASPPSEPSPAVAANEAAGKPVAGSPIEPAASSLEPIAESGPEPAESPPTTSPPSEPVVEPELKAIADLAARLKPDNMVKREDYRAEIMEKYGVSAKLYDGYVWPRARERAGLPPKGSPGPKTQSGNKSRRD